MTPLPAVPADLIPTLLPLLLPPTVPLPPHLLSPVFRHRLVYLPPLSSEMDRQLSPFPMSITSDALQRRLESLAGGYEVGLVTYAWDGESGLAKRAVFKEGGGEQEWRENSGEAGVEMHFLHDKEEGWGFHGLRLPGQAEEMGLDWVDDPRDLDIGGAGEDEGLSSSVSTLRTEGVDGGNGSLDQYAYTQSGGEIDDAEVKDYWAGFSPPQSPKLGADTMGSDGAMLDEEERERQYWAQYSNGPSKAASPAISRRASEMVVPREEMKDDERGRQMGDNDASGSHRHRSGTIVPSSTSHTSQQQSSSSPSSKLIPGIPSGIPVPAESASPPTEASTSHPSIPRQSSPRNTNSSSNTDSTLLRSRLRMKTISLLKREWIAYSQGAEEQDELEEKGIRWLAIGRNSGAVDVGSGKDGREEDALRHTLRILKEMFETFEDQSEGEEGGGFYRLVEQALAQELPNGEQDGPGDRGGLSRKYSYDQATYWE